jgi:hypothetical protein
MDRIFERLADFLLREHKRVLVFSIAILGMVVGMMGR